MCILGRDWATAAARYVPWYSSYIYIYIYTYIYMYIHVCILYVYIYVHIIQRLSCGSPLIHVMALIMYVDRYIYNAYILTCKFICVYICIYYIETELRQLFVTYQGTHLIYIEICIYMCTYICVYYVCWYVYIIQRLSYGSSSIRAVVLILCT